MSGSSCICAICYEDVVPSSELLQTIVVCGHVFHELCLQQWIEFCPNGRKPTCPLCKSSCGVRDVHRLYFQSSSDSSPLTADPSNSPPQDAKTSQVDRLRFSKLEAKVQTLTNASQAFKEQILELEGREARYSEQVRVLESEKLKGRKEKGQLLESLARTREELRRSCDRRQDLLERNEAMAKDLAVYQLATDVNLTEDEMLRLVSVDRVSAANKDDIIDTMTKSLYLRNRAFKELMHKCQELGMGESRAEQKSGKLMEQLKRMKARMQELANAEEEKENAEVRSLRTSNPHRGTPTTRRPLIPHHDGNSFAHLSVLNNSEKNDVFLHPNSESRKISEISVASLKSHPKLPVCPDSDVNETLAQEGKVVKKSAVGFTEMAPASESNPGELNLNRINVKDSSQLDSDHIRMLQVGHQAFSSREDTVDNPNWADEARTMLESGNIIGADGRLSYEEGSSPDGGPSGTQRTMRPKITIGLDGDIDNVEVLGRRPMLPIRQELGLGQGVQSFTSPKSVMGSSQVCVTPTLPQSSFIVSGADGRGGRVTVLKPPRIFPGGSSSTSSLIGVQRAKRFKPTSHIAGARPTAVLKIEHFFGRG